MAHVAERMAHASAHERIKEKTGVEFSHGAAWHQRYTSKQRGLIRELANTMNQIDLNGKTAIVTGGARGIGFAIAQRLLTSGASVSIWDIDATALADAAQSLATLGSVHTLKLNSPALARWMRRRQPHMSTSGGSTY